MDWQAERHRRGIQSASIVFVCILVAVVVATGIFALSTPTLSAISPTTVTSGNDVQVLGTGPISTFPASWTDICGNLVSGNETTLDPNFGPMSPLSANNLTLSQVYSRIVNSSVFRNLAAGRSWVTVEWGIGAITGSGGGGTFVGGDFQFLTGGIPEP